MYYEKMLHSWPLLPDARSHLLVVEGLRETERARLQFAEK